MIHYEFPLNEKVRTWLRLEDLFARVRYFIEQEAAMDHHAALTTLFEILEASGRADLKSELLQELERQRRALSHRLESDPGFSENMADITLQALERASADLLAMLGKVGQHLRKNEWLMVIKQRASVPGGTCEFDLPSYHYWLQQSPAARQADLEAWLAPLLPIHAGIEIALRLLRNGGNTLSFTARKGSFQQMQGGRNTQMLRLALSRSLACVPEVGANRYAINIRFLNADYSAKSTLFDQDVVFSLTFCELA